MSASASKKKRKELDQQGLSKQQLAQKTKQETKKKTLRNVLIILAALIVVAAIIFGTIKLTEANRYAADYDVKAAAATVGEHQITVPMFNYFYNSTASNYAQMYVAYGMIQANTPLSEQSFSETQTWEDFFIETTKTNIQQVYNIYDEAMKDGYTLTTEDQAAIDMAVNNMKAEAKAAGMANVDYYLAQRCGLGCNLENFKEYLNVTQIYSSYTTQKQESFAPTAEEVAEAYAADKASYDTVAFRYTRINAESQEVASEEETTEEETTDADAPAETEYTAEAKEKAKADAEAAKATVAAEGTALTGNKNTVVSYLNEDATSWLFDESRKEGDVEVFADAEDTVYYVVSFTSRDDNDYNRSTAYVVNIPKQDTEGQPTAAETLAVLDKAKEDKLSDEDFEKVLTDNGFSVSVTPIARNYSNEDIRNFVYDESRQSGDMATFEDDTYYYVVRFAAKEEQTYQYTLVSSDLQNDKANEWFTQVSETNAITVDDALLANANTDLTFYSNQSAN